MAKFRGLRERARKGLHHFGLIDWVGDALLALACGIAIMCGSFLPFANSKIGEGHLNWSATRPDMINGAIASGFGVPMLVTAGIVVAAAVCMIALGPRRFMVGGGVVLIVVGLVVVGQSGHAAASARMYGYSPGLGLFVTTLAGILLVPIGLASGMVAWILSDPARAAVAAGGEPPPQV